MNFNDSKTIGQFCNKNGIKIDSCGDGYCVGSIEFSENAKNPVGIVHGGLIFSLCDTVAGVAAWQPGKFPITKSGEIRFLRPAAEAIFAEAKVVSKDNGNSFVQVYVKDHNRGIIACADFIMVLKDKSTLL